MKECDFTIPASIERDPDSAVLFQNALENLQSVYDDLLKAGLPAEDARYILPNAAETKILMTANARSLLNFFEIRTCTRAQWEIRQLARLMLDEVRTVAPNIFKLAGPTCETQGFCREGAKSCGRAAPLSYQVTEEAE